MKKIALLAVILALLPAIAHATAPATCAITGVVYDGAGNPVPNATIYFSSMNTQIVGGNTIAPFNVSSTTDSSGTLSTTALVQGTYVQIVICRAQGGGCGSPATGFVPVSSIGIFSTIQSGQNLPIASVLSGPLNASGYQITSVGADTAPGDALSNGNSTINSLGAAIGPYSMNGYKLTHVAAGTGSNDALAYGVNVLNNLAAATANYPMGGFTLTGLAAPTLSGEPLVDGTTVTIAQGGTGATTVAGALTALTLTQSTNTALGVNSFTANTSGTDNTAIGAQALEYNTSGALNTSIGQQSMDSNTSGVYNTAVGQGALGGNTSGTYNVGIGVTALESNTTGSDNVAVGYEALNAFNDIGSGYDSNTAIGTLAGSVDTTGASNIFIGYGGNITTGSSNILIGNSLSGTVATTSNQIDIGDRIFGSMLIAALPSCASTIAGARAAVTNNDAACAINSAPAHSTCTVGTNCYTCQVQCAEAGSTSYSWIIY